MVTIGTKLWRTVFTTVPMTLMLLEKKMDSLMSALAGKDSHGIRHS
jgi:hypothetical protein